MASWNFNFGPWNQSNQIIKIRKVHTECDQLNFRPSTFDKTKVADEEALPFKTIYALAQTVGLRIMITPESTHSLWNSVRNGLRRAGKQYCLLLSMAMSNMAHGPFKSGRNHQSLIEAAQYLSSNMSADQDAFNDLIDGWCRDLHIESDIGDDLMSDAGLPETPEDIPLHRAIQNLPVYDTWWHK